MRKIKMPEFALTLSACCDETLTRPSGGRGPWFCNCCGTTHKIIHPPHEADFRHSIASWSDERGDRIESGTCRYCRSPFTMIKPGPGQGDPCPARDQLAVIEGTRS